MLNIVLVTPQKEFLCSPSNEVIIPTISGEIGVLEGHVNLFANITSGVLKLKSKEKTDCFAIHHGFAYINNDTVSIVVKLCELAQEIDKIRVEVAEGKAIKNLNHQDHNKWENKLRRSVTRRQLLPNS